MSLRDREAELVAEAAAGVVEQEALRGDKQALQARVQELFAETYPEGVAAAIAADPSIAERIPAQSRAFCAQAAADQTTVVQTSAPPLDVR